MRRRPVRELARAAARLSLPAWVVGGAVRDMWLGRPVLDVDIAVSGDIEPLARELSLRGLGRVVPLSLEWPRVFRLAGRGTEIDLGQLERGSIEADLGRRDFTANALAIALPGGSLTDPFGGVADLAARRLRAVAPENFEEDPLRALRAARFLATHGLTPDAATFAICRAAAPGLNRVAPERIRTELARLLEAPRAGPALAWAARAQLLDPALGRDVPGSARARLQGGRLPVDAPSLRRLPPDARRRARLALLARALLLSPRDAARWLAARRWSREEAGAVANLCDLACAARAARTQRDEWRWVRDAGARAKEALAVLMAGGAAGQRRARRLRARVAAARRGPVVTGADVLDWLALAPGPAVGRLLAELAVESLSGRVRTRRQARKWLEGRAPAIIHAS